MGSASYDRKNWNFFRTRPASTQLRTTFTSRRTSAAVLVCLCAASAWAQTPVRRAKAPAAGRESLLGVVPFLPPERLELTFAHMAARFSEVLGREVRFRTATTWARYEESLRAGEYDFAVVGPFVYTRIASEAYVTLGRTPGRLTAEFVVLEDSPLAQLSDLRGKTLATGPTRSDVDYLTRYALAEQGIVPGKDVELLYFESPLSCLQQLLAGTAPACATMSLVREAFAAGMGVKLKVIAESAGVPRGPVLAHRRVPEGERETVRKLLSSWADDPANRLPVPGAQVPSIIPIEPGEYDVVQRILASLQER
jgi:ABC-type phosphate/phosphonate transport system substrate-binding protein